MKTGSMERCVWKERFSYLKDVPFTQDDFRAPGAKFQIVKFAPGAVVAPHWHEKTVEVFFIRQGAGVLRLAGKEFRCKPDDFFLCEPGDVHEFINDTDSEFVILIFKTNEEADDIRWE